MGPRNLTRPNDPTDLGVLRRLQHLDELSARGRDVNRRMVDNLRVGQGCVLASPAFERVARPTIEDGRRAPALRFGDPRVMALAGALCACVLAVGGFTNRSLRAQVTTLLGVPLHSSTNELRPSATPDERPHRAPGALQHLHPDRRRTSGCGVLSQSARPAAAPADRREQPTRAAAATAGPENHRAACLRLPRPGPDGSLRTWLKRQPPSDQASLVKLNVPRIRPR